MPWIYLAGPKGPSKEETFNLAARNQVIVKNCFRNIADTWQFTNKVQHLKEGHVLYLAYRGNNTIQDVRRCTLRRFPVSTHGKRLNKHVAIPEEKRKKISAVFGYSPKPCKLHEELKKLQCKMDPKVKTWTTLSVTVESVRSRERLLKTFQEWYGNLKTGQNTIVEIGADILPI